MLSQTQINAYIRDTEQLTGLAQSKVSTLVTQIAAYPDRAEDMLNDLLYEAIRGSSDAASALAAEMYDELRMQSGVRSGYTAIAPGLNEEAVRQSIYSTLAEWEESGSDLGFMFQRLLDVTDRRVFGDANDTIRYNVLRDPAKPRYARVLGSDEACAFCTMLASRGFVYRSEESANHRHTNCKCTVWPSWGFDPMIGSPPIEGYDPQALYDTWRDAQKVAGAPSYGKDSYGWEVTKELKAHA